MAKKVQVGNISTEITKILKQYKEATVKDLDAAKDAGAAAGLSVLKTIGGYEDRTGKYRKSLSKRKDKSARLLYSNNHYRLTHLLEHGHALRNGGRAKAFPHWEPAEKVAIEVMEKDIIRRLKK